MKEFKEFTFYEPYGTSLRMGDIGYTNHKDHDRGIKASYNSLDEYIASLRCAINTPHKEYEDIGLKDGDEYLQLNTNILQIENEYYSSVRPKQILQGMEKPTDALEQRGIQYVELRSVDINAFRPAGMTHQQLYFLEIFMMFCLLQDSPEITDDEAKEIDANQSIVAHQGRKPNLQLSRNSKEISLKKWSTQLLDEMSGVADLLNKAHDETCYTKAMQGQKELVDDPSKTPSAMVLDDIMNRDGSYYHFAKRKSEEHRDYFLQRKLEAEIQQSIELVAQKSLKEQRETEEKNGMDFDTFLKKYFDNQL
jgi:glutamate--cysteine ligase